jgi:hypothetical protein
MNGGSRRNFIKLGLSGLSLSQFLAIRSHGIQVDPKSAVRGFGSAKSCIVLFAWGGLSHLDTFDMKPDAPSNVRSRFKEMATDVPGIRIGEHLPGFARMMKEWAVVRSAHHNAPSHRSGAYWNLTGHEPPNLSGNWPASRSDWPCLGSMVWEALGDGRGPIPGAVALPYTLYDGGVANGQDGGFLGLGRDPVVLRPTGKKLRQYGGKSPSSGRVNLNLPEGLDAERLNGRRRLMLNLEAGALTVGQAESRAVVNSRERALDMLLNSKARDAFDLEKESAKARESYGLHVCGQSVLTARRLIEAGVPIATVYCAAGDLNGSKGDHFDTHANNFNRLKNNMLPPLDQAATALIADLKARGLLEETLVVLLTEFGRTPKINGGAGRDHFPDCYSVAYAGAGIQGGQLYGASDNMGAKPVDKGCSPADLHATIFHALGIDPARMVMDRDRRPLPLCDGKPLPLFS